jgi:MFS family permease
VTKTNAFIEHAPAEPESIAGRRRDSRRFALVLYVFTVLLYWSALYFYVPTLPMYVHSKIGDLVVVGAVLSMYGLWQALARLPVGMAADRIGRRKPFILLGPIMALLGAWVMGHASGSMGLFVGRGITGLAAAAWVPMVAAFNALFPPKEAVRASALITLVSSLGCIIGTSLNGRLNEIGGYGLAFTLAAGMGGAALVVGLALPEPPLTGQRPSARDLARVVTRRVVWLPSLLSGVSHYVLFTATYGFLPILGQRLGLGDVAQGLLVSLNLASTAVGNLGVAALGKRIGSRRLAYGSFALLALGAGLAAVAQSPALILAAQICIGLGQGTSYPVLMGLSMRHVGQGERTAAIGAFQALYGIGMFAGPAVNGLVASAVGIQPMFGITALTCLALGWLGTRKLQE